MGGVKVALVNSNYGGGCVTMCERQERTESPGAYVTD